MKQIDHNNRKKISELYLCGRMIKKDKIIIFKQYEAIQTIQVTYWDVITEGNSLWNKYPINRT